MRNGMTHPCQYCLILDRTMLDRLKKSGRETNTRVAEIIRIAIDELFMRIENDCKVINEGIK